jgi:hypothetical protein
METEHGDHIVSFDFKAGYRHFRPSPKMRNWFLFRYEDKYYCCVALPFGWGRNPMWFIHLMVPLAFQLPTGLGYRVLSYLDDFLVCPAKAGTVATRRDCCRAVRVISKPLGTLGLTRHLTKGEWSGSTRVEHLGCIIDTKLMRFFSAPRKIVRVQEMARSLIRQAREGRRWVPRERLRSFCGLCVSLSLPMPYARLYSRSLYDDMSTRRVDTRGSSRNSARCRLSHQSQRDLKA